MPQPAKRPLDQSTIEVKVKSQDGRQLYFRINRSTPLQRLLVAYCQRINIDYKTMQFVYNGNRVTAKQTPEQVFFSTLQYLLHILTPKSRRNLFKIHET